MNYHPDDFLSLVEEAELQGGAHLSEECRPSIIRMNLPIDDENPRGPKVNRQVPTTGCHRHAKFLVPFLPDAYFTHHDPTDATIASITPEGEFEHRDAETSDFDWTAPEKALLMKDGTPALAKVCAVDDAMGLWPRFQDSMHTGQSFQEG